LFFGPLLRLRSTAQDQHGEVAEERHQGLRVVRLAAHLDETVDYENLTPISHGCVTILENLGGSFVTPVVDDSAHEVSVTPHLHRLEKLTVANFTATEHTSPLKKFARSSHDVGAIEQNSTNTRIGAQNSGQQHAVAAADVHNRMESREIVRVHHRLRDHGG